MTAFLNETRPTTWRILALAIVASVGANVLMNFVVGPVGSNVRNALGMKKVIEWLAKISTPPDSRAGGRRHLPPIGNTYMHEPTSELGHIAYLWRDRDPEFASHMQWMHRQHGSRLEPGIGGFYPTLAGYRTFLVDPAIPEKPPAWTSELFPEAGVMLRNGFPTDRETQLCLIAGRLHDHYDDDSGSFTLWGKGRLLANDFGYSSPNEFVACCADARA